jgi:hypothetical protein
MSGVGSGQKTWQAPARMTIDVIQHRANGMSRVFWESIWGPADEIDANNASPMPHQLSHTCTSRTTSYPYGSPVMDVGERVFVHGAGGVRLVPV